MASWRENIIRLKMLTNYQTFFRKIRISSFKIFPKFTQSISLNWTNGKILQICPCNNISIYCYGYIMMVIRKSSLPIYWISNTNPDEMNWYRRWAKKVIALRKLDIFTVHKAYSFSLGRAAQAEMSLNVYVCPRLKIISSTKLEKNLFI